MAIGLYDHLGAADVLIAGDPAACATQARPQAGAEIGVEGNLHSGRMGAYSGASAHPFRQHAPTYSGVFAHL